VRLSVRLLACHKSVQPSDWNVLQSLIAAAIPALAKKNPRLCRWRHLAYVIRWKIDWLNAWWSTEASEPRQVQMISADGKLHPFAVRITAKCSEYYSLNAHLHLPHHCWLIERRGRGRPMASTVTQSICRPSIYLSGPRRKLNSPLLYYYRIDKYDYNGQPKKTTQVTELY